MWVWVNVWGLSNNSKWHCMHEILTDPSVSIWVIVLLVPIDWADENPSFCERAMIINAQNKCLSMAICIAAAPVTSLHMHTTDYRLAAIRARVQIAQDRQAHPGSCVLVLDRLLWDEWKKFGMSEGRKSTSFDELLKTHMDASSRVL